ncbi:terminase, partial [Enterobacter hormaechei subsp. xiangfangensis]
PAAVKTTRNVSAKKAPAKNTNSPAKRGRGRPKKVAG